MSNVLNSGTGPHDAARTHVAAARSLAAAFAVDPILTWLIPVDAQRRTRLERFFHLEIVHVVAPTGRVLLAPGAHGALLELPPGHWRMPFSAQLAHASTFAGIFRRRLLHAFGLITTMERRHPREPHYYIPYVGITPDAQGQGLGSALLNQTIRRCDAESIPAYLEATSEANAALYERLGFEHLGAFTFGGSPPLWPMRRRPSVVSPVRQGDQHCAPPQRNPGPGEQAP